MWLCRHTAQAPRPAASPRGRAGLSSRAGHIGCAIFDLIKTGAGNSRIFELRAKARKSGYDDQDTTAVCAVLEKMAGVKRRKRR
jgi:hypothetical protein